MELFTLTKRKRLQSEKVMTVVWAILTILFAAMIYFIVFAIFPTILFAVLWYIWATRRYLEYEVSYFDGDFRIAKIMNKSRRKKIMNFTMDEVIQIAPAGDRCVYKYENDVQTKLVNCYSMEADAKPYDIVFKKENKFTLVKVELDDRMLAEMCKKYQQKVVRYS